MNWESIAVAATGPLLVLLGLVYQEYRKRKNAREDADATRQAKREPTWNEVVNENRQLRKDLDEQGEKHDAEIKELKEEFRKFRRKTDTRIGALSNLLHSAASQWPATHPAPTFDPDDLAALENTDVPYVWRNRIRPVSGP